MKSLKLCKNDDENLVIYTDELNKANSKLEELKSENVMLKKHLNAKSNCRNGNYLDMVMIDEKDFDKSRELFPSSEAFLESLINAHINLAITCGKLAVVYGDLAIAYVRLAVIYGELSKIYAKLEVCHENLYKSISQIDNLNFENVMLKKQLFSK